jgi:hypothetical protein
MSFPVGAGLAHLIAPSGLNFPDTSWELFCVAHESLFPMPNLCPNLEAFDVTRFHTQGEPLGALSLLLTGISAYLLGTPVLLRLMLYESIHTDALHLLIPTLGLLRGHCERFFHPHLPVLIGFEDGFEEF